MITVQDVLSNLFSVSIITELSNWLAEKDLDFPQKPRHFSLPRINKSFRTCATAPTLASRQISPISVVQVEIILLRKDPIISSGNTLCTVSRAVSATILSSQHFRQSTVSPQNHSWKPFKIITSIWKQSAQNLPITGDMFLPTTSYPWWNRDMSAMVHKPAFILWN